MLVSFQQSGNVSLFVMRVSIFNRVFCFSYTGQNDGCVLMQCWNRYDFTLLKANDETQISEYYYGESAKRLEMMKPE